MTYNYTDAAKKATNGLPSNIDYSPFIKQTTNEYSESDVQGLRSICLTVARISTDKTNPHYSKITFI
jgi:hypothetical protein